MVRVYHYIYYHLYLFSSKLTKRRPEYSAILYIGVIVSLPLLPLLGEILSYLFDVSNYYLFSIPFLLITFKIVSYNEKYFDRKRIAKIKYYYKGRSTAFKVVGVILSLVLLLFSLSSFFVYFYLRDKFF